jgi:integrase/RNA polymerase subunit RPABC4/transcription elongation factor Spt4
MPTALKSENDILTGDELERMFQSMKNLRDRTFIEVLYDSMGRINEVCTLQWNQIVFHDNHAVITLQSKTDKPRKIPLHTSHVTLKLWNYQYPNRASPDDYVFFGMGGPSTPMKTRTARDMVKKSAERAGITKHVVPHIFRHTRITDLLRVGVREQTIKMMGWGTITTDMLQVYAHLTPQDSVNDMNKFMGIEPIQKTQPLADIVTPAQCPHCGIITSKLNPFCPMCGSAMSDKVTDEFNRFKSLIDQDEEYQEYVRRKAEMAREFEEKVR